MTSASPGRYYSWQNPILRDTIYPHRMKKLREFLLFYWDADYLEKMNWATEDERRTAWRNAAAGIRARRAEWQQEFSEAFDELVANDKAFAVKTTEKYQIWYLHVKSGMKSPLFRGLKRPLISGKNVRWTGGGGCFRIR